MAQVCGPGLPEHPTKNGPQRIVVSIDVTDLSLFHRLKEYLGKILSQSPHLGRGTTHVTVPPRSRLLSTHYPSPPLYLSPERRKGLIPTRFLQQFILLGRTRSS
ncbi:unnamed protein product [Larinioides sclopetarius]|uniref:Uncharacterized protein n=1 Tax=Larinioides sclopetarius TaxID=280406 RepID=A0AAV2AJW1_9ARAC